MLFGSAPRPVVVDIGGGKALEYRDRVEPSEAYIIAVDVSEAELSENTDVDEKRVADVTRALPFDDGEVDVLTSSSVLEHLDELGGFLDEAARVVSEGGLMVHLFPSRYASFAIINRALPETLKRRLLYSLYPNTKGVCGFPANYDHCYASAIVRECERRGFTIEVLELSYYGSSDYYRVFFPVFIVSWSGSSSRRSWAPRTSPPPFSSRPVARRSQRRQRTARSAAEHRRQLGEPWGHRAVPGDLAKHLVSNRDVDKCGEVAVRTRDPCVTRSRHAAILLLDEMHTVVGFALDDRSGAVIRAVVDDDQLEVFYAEAKVHHNTVVASPGGVQAFDNSIISR